MHMLTTAPENSSAKKFGKKLSWQQIYKSRHFLFLSKNIYLPAELIAHPSMDVHPLQVVGRRRGDHGHQSIETDPLQHRLIDTNQSQSLMQTLAEGVHVKEH